ncbi:hypothetical protein [[Mycobacterium] burgundiense]|uniref:Uncharacterized protein n=1 Tax=[Mycobacterium] burgundiense TaxID=3064286 RepID=A0ABN9NSC9_9MYCO|nr:hypothetical protein [Mycolicibacterium sp. MU0053]CAJ1511124.1 hypothetical protein MU0053_005041 [Mycolicibacterium sp. MU0053]
MEHPVAVEGVIVLDGRVQRILGQAQVDPVEVLGYAPRHGLEVIGSPLIALRAPRAGAVRMDVIGRQCRDERRQQFGFHDASTGLARPCGR